MLNRHKHGVHDTNHAHQNKIKAEQAKLSHPVIDIIFLNIVNSGLSITKVGDKTFNLSAWKEYEILMEIEKSEVISKKEGDVQLVTLHVMGFCKTGTKPSKPTVIKINIQRLLAIERDDGDPPCTTEFLNCNWEVLKIRYYLSPENMEALNTVVYHYEY